MDNDRQKALEESIHVYQSVIRSFAATRARLQERRKGAIVSVAAHIDESLALNERTLAALKSVLTAAQEQLRDERARAGSAQ